MIPECGALGLPFDLAILQMPPLPVWGRVSDPSRPSEARKFSSNTDPGCLQSVGMQQEPAELRSARRVPSASLRAGSDPSLHKHMSPQGQSWTAVTRSNY